MHNLSSKGAGLGALSAFCVARRRTSLRGEELGFVMLVVNVSDDKAIWRCAKVGGLKDESRTCRVFGGDLGASQGIEELVGEVCKFDGRDVRTLNVDLEDAKEERRDR
jgi:hypothetical protein